LGVVITKWTKATKPIGTTGCVIGFVAINWHGLIVEGFQVIRGERGLFLEFPRTRTSAGRWLRLVRFRTVAEQEAFRSEVLAWLMKSYPEDFEGLEAEKPRQR
jgi:DNA-binding cell septation regulator SpoVG